MLLINKEGKVFEEQKTLEIVYRPNKIVSVEEDIGAGRKDG